MRRWSVSICLNYTKLLFQFISGVYTLVLEITNLFGEGNLNRISSEIVNVGSPTSNMDYFVPGGMSFLKGFKEADPRVEQARHPDWTGKNVETMDHAELQQVFDAVDDRLYGSIITVNSATVVGRLSQEQQMKVVQTLFGFNVGVLIVIANSFVDLPNGSQEAYISAKVGSGVNFIQFIGKVVAAENEDLYKGKK